MITGEIDALCVAIVENAANLKLTLSSQGHIPEILERFWTIQDSMARLLSAAADQPKPAFETLRAYPSLVVETFGMLEAAARSRLAQLAAIAQSCAAINELLLQLEYFKQEHGLIH